MPTKFMRKQMMIVMVELVILFLVEVKANNFALTFAHRPSLPIMLPHSSTYDEVQEYFVDCILHKFHNCQNKDNKHSVQFLTCMFNSFVECKEKHEHHTMPNINRFHDAQACIDACLEISKSSFASCFEDCYTADSIMH